MIGSDVINNIFRLRAKKKNQANTLLLFWFTHMDDVRYRTHRVEPVLIPISSENHFSASREPVKYHYFNS